MLQLDVAERQLFTLGLDVAEQPAERCRQRRLPRGVRAEQRTAVEPRVEIDRALTTSSRSSPGSSAAPRPAWDSTLAPARPALSARPALTGGAGVLYDAPVRLSGAADPERSAPVFQRRPPQRTEKSSAPDSGSRGRADCCLRTLRVARRAGRTRPASGEPRLLC